MAKKLQKMFLIYYNLLIPQGLWQTHYQIWLIIFLNKFAKSDLNIDTMINMVKLAGLNISIMTIFSNIQILKMVG